MTEENHPIRNINPKIWQIVVIAFIAIAFTAVWLSTYEYLDKVIWMNDFVATHRWTIIVGVLGFSLLVGLCEKYLHAPNVIHGGFSDSMKGEGVKSDYKAFPGTLLSSFVSLFSGASVGPEGPLAFLIMEISVWTREKLKILNDAALGFDVAALSSAYNGIIGSPLFTAVFATEFNVGKKDALTFLAWNLLAGVIGFLFFSLLGLRSFASMLAFPSISEVTGLYVLYAVLLGVLGAVIAILMGLAMQGIGVVMEKTFKDKILTRILAAGIIIAIICYLIPDLMFSGETQILGIINQAAEIGVAMLLLMAVLKALLLALSFKSGYLGGPIFPTVFTCTMIGLTLSLVFPGVPVGIFVLCIIAAVITLALGAPLTAILLVIVMGAANQYMIALLVLSSVVALIFGTAVRQLREKRAGKEVKVSS
ncbi:MAG: chloride channel protein [Methanomicrobiales archaeon]